MFVYCFFGKMATESFEQMSICLYESNWTEFSVDLQKYIMLMIQNSQRTLFYHGFGIINLDLMTFCKVSGKSLEKIAKKCMVKNSLIDIYFFFNYIATQIGFLKLHDVQNINWIDKKWAVSFCVIY